jgi:long-chain fatty acid transport protein
MAQHKTLKISTLLMASAFSTMSYGAGYAVAEQSVTGLGRAFAGQAAVAEDASTIFFNPAGLTYLTHSQIAQGLNFILPQSEFNDNGSNAPALGGAPLGGREGDAGNLAIVPNLYYAHRLNDDVVLGIGVNAPFGLVTEYSDNWIGRYHAIKSDLLTININPSIGFKATERLSLGFGINLQYIDLELTQAVDFGTICASALVGACAAPLANDGKVKLEADDWSWGFNLGLMFQATDATRVAVTYRSKIEHHLTGKGEFSIPTNVPGALAGALGFNNGAISGNVALPESASLAIHHQVNDKWAVMADASWTRWERFEELAIVAADPTSKLNSTKEESWENSMRYGLGLTYAHNDKWTFRGGIAYDETPISDDFRTARIPGEDRKWVAVGASYKYSDHITIDAGYTHIFVSNPEIDESLDLPLNHELVGDYDASVDILGVQMRWLFI